LDLLKSENGFTIIETLVAILLLGLLVVGATGFFGTLYNSPKILLRNEALALASNEIDRCISYRILTDTLYKNPVGNLQVKRNVIMKADLNEVIVGVYWSDKNKKLIELKVLY